MIAKIEIPAHQIDIFEIKVKKINKFIIKNGFPPITWEIESYSYRPDLDDISNVPVFKKIIKINLEYLTIKVGDYCYIGHIDHEENGNLIHSIEGEKIPKEYWERETCDHCNVSRHRNKTYIFKNGIDIKQIGSTCLKLYTGFDPSVHLKILSFVNNVAKEVENHGGGKGFEEYETKMILSLASIVIKKYGYVSNKKSREEESKGNLIQSTSSRIMDLLCPIGFIRDEFRPEYNAIWEKALLEDVTEVLESGRKFFESKEDEYSHNMKIVLSGKYTNKKGIPYICSLIPMTSEKPQTTKNTSQFVGEPGKKHSCNVMVKKIIPSESYYGLTYIIIMEDELNNTLVWFSSKFLNINENQSYSLIGTIKSHNIRNEIHQTVVTRCKLSPL